MERRILFILIVAFLIRLISLNQSLWLDEATTARVVQQFGLWEIVNKFSVNDFHPPTYYLLMKLWTSLFGTSEITLRIPSVIFSLVTGWLIYLIGKKLKDKSTGLCAATLFLFNPLIVYYSQEARMYLLVTLLVTASFYYLLKVISRHSGEQMRLQNRFRTSRNDVVYCNLFIFVSFITFYGSIFFIAAVYLYLLITRQFKLLALLLPGFVLSFLLISPLLLQQYLNSQLVTQTVVNWKQVLGPATLKNLALIPLKFSFGRISFEPKIIYYALSGLWTMTVFYFVFKQSSQKQEDKTLFHRVYLLFFLFMTPLILGFIFSFFTPLLQYFRFIYLIPMMSILIALSIDKNWQGSLLIGGFFILVLVYLLNPRFHREDWKSLAAGITSDKVYMIPSSADPLLYYNNKLEILDIRNIKPGEKKSITLIPYTADIHGVNYKSQLENKKYILKNKESFRGITKETWKSVR